MPRRFRGFRPPPGPPPPGKGPFQGRPPEPIAAWIGFELMSAAHQAMYRVEHTLEQLGISPLHHAILLALGQAAPQSQKALGETLSIDRTTVVHLLDELEEKQAVRRDPDPRDRRAHAVHLTESGEQILEAANRGIRESSAEFLAVLTPPEQQQLREFLHRLGAQPGGGEPGDAPDSPPAAPAP